MLFAGAAQRLEPSVSLPSAPGGLSVVVPCVRTSGVFQGDKPMEPFHVAHLVALGFGELPILFGVLVTGTILAVRAWPLTPLHFIKIATSLVAVGSALICTLWVFQRRKIEDVNVLLGFRRRIWTLAAVAAVFATPALYLGLVYFRSSC